MDVQQIKSYIETNCLDTHTMIIDESMEPWVAPQWRQDSLIHHRECVKQLRETRRINGRAGPRSRRAAHRRATHTAEIKRKGVSWPVNSMALAFVYAVVKDDAYYKLCDSEPHFTYISKLRAQPVGKDVEVGVRFATGRRTPKCTHATGAWFKHVSRNLGPVACCRGNGVPPAPPSRNPIPPTPASLPDFDIVRLGIYSLLTKSVDGLTSDSSSDGTLYKCALFVYAAWQCALSRTTVAAAMAPRSASLRRRTGRGTPA
ncbi:hypothetical protein PF005_g5653 [Phytophthora fragariae]|uniref:Uncharacterized protein n=1 Tax=Phytophthora fragariae TaxID=53985 RepID=A0A6A3YX18_9STRA|nr:hypothetical protein PF005_g5653 [Phytophthora fragariae]